jgi:precorrin-2/cobalt-factor-2 C20-methyltransferase
MENGKVLARAIVAGYLRPEQREIPMPLPFSPDRSAQPYYDRAAAEIAPHLQAGRDVAVLCEGEPMLYGSFMYLFQRLAPQFPTEVIPGISSTLACGAMLGLPLTFRHDVLTLIPATLSVEKLKTRLQETDAAVILKIGRHFAKVYQVLTELDLLPRAHYIEYATQPTQRIVPITTLDPEKVTYWSLIVIPSQGYPQ